MTIQVKQEFRCPICSAVFEDPLAAPGPFAGMESDTRPLYRLKDPLPFLVHTCPNCCYSALENGFSGQPPGGLRTWILSGGLGRLQDPAPSRRFTLAARCKEKAGGTAREVGDLYLHASWAARVEGDGAMARLARARALQAFGRALAEGGLDQAGEARLHYLLGELSRLQGEFAQAQALLSRLTHPSWAIRAAKALDLARRGDDQVFRFQPG